MTIKFRNRAEAGQMLARKLTAYAHCQDVLILGLPRGGVLGSIRSSKSTRCATGYLFGKKTRCTWS